VSGTPGAPVRVLVADGDPLLRRALVRLLQDTPAVEIVAVAADGAATLALALQLQPAVTILDARLVQPDGMVLIRHLRLLTQAPRIVVLSVYATVREQALAAGACQFLLKDCGREPLVAAILRAAQGHCQALANNSPDWKQDSSWPGEPR
jgi:DNA-binding NarL/FixJ family response regulator